jgi:hypothetical protein
MGAAATPETASPKQHRITIVIISIVMAEIPQMTGYVREAEYYYPCYTTLNLWLPSESVAQQQPVSDNFTSTDSGRTERLQVDYDWPCGKGA